MIIGVALAEALALYAFVIAILLGDRGLVEAEASVRRGPDGPPA